MYSRSLKRNKIAVGRIRVSRDLLAYTCVHKEAFEQNTEIISMSEFTRKFEKFYILDIPLLPKHFSTLNQIYQKVFLICEFSQHLDASS